MAKGRRGTGHLRPLEAAIGFLLWNSLLMRYSPYLTPTKLAKLWGVRPIGVLHIGAHEAEETAYYEAAGWGFVTWVEGNAEKVGALNQKLPAASNRVVEAFAWDIDFAELNFWVLSDSASSSLFRPTEHLALYPEKPIVKEERAVGRRLDQLLTNETRFEFISVDVQGAELQALRGLGSRIAEAKWILAEVNQRDLYEGCTRVEDLDAFLAGVGFKRTSTLWVPGKGWGDALYSRVGLTDQQAKPLHRFFQRFEVLFGELYLYLADIKQKLL